jgi:hypothetical protein
MRGFPLFFSLKKGEKPSYTEQKLALDLQSKIIQRIILLNKQI